VVGCVWRGVSKILGVPLEAEQPSSLPGLDGFDQIVVTPGRRSQRRGQVADALMVE
jgi:hypothetical protein